MKYNKISRESKYRSKHKITNEFQNNLILRSIYGSKKNFCEKLNFKAEHFEQKLFIIHDFSVIILYRYLYEKFSKNRHKIFN